MRKDEILWTNTFFKVATTQADLLFIELMSYLSHVKYINNYIIHFTHELVEITWEWADFNGDSTAKALAGTQFLTCDHLTQIFCDLQQYFPHRIWPYSWLQTVRPIQAASTLGCLFCSSPQQAIRNAVQTFPEPICLERVWCPCAWLTCSGFCKQMIWLLLHSALLLSIKCMKRPFSE